jgi:hypothetical protein
MEKLRKLIFLGILINLITLSSCESDDLYQNYINEQQKALEEIEENLIGKTDENVVPVKRDLAASENEYEDGDDDGENEQDEHFRLLFNHMRAYRDQKGLTGGIGGEKNGELFKV